MNLKAQCEQKVCGARENWEVLSVDFDIKEITQSGKESLEFEDCSVELTKENPLREIYFHEEGRSEEELSYFSIELNGENGTVFVNPGNCDVESVTIDNIAITQQENVK